MELVPKRPYNGGTDWFSRSGFSVTEDYFDNSASRIIRYAARLARYISDPSTVRARVFEQYGSAPSLEKIAALRADWVSEVEQRRAARAPDDWDEEPGLVAVLDEVRPDDISAAIQAQARVEAAASLRQALAHATATDVPQLLAHAVSEPIVPIPRTVSEIIERCASRFNLSAEDVLGRRRMRPIVRARQFTATVLRARRNSYPKVGKYLADLDHSTVIHAVQAHFAVGMRDPAYARAWMAEAPCMTKMARTVPELDMLIGVNR